MEQDTWESGKYQSVANAITASDSVYLYWLSASLLPAPCQETPTAWSTGEQAAEFIVKEMILLLS